MNYALKKSGNKQLTKEKEMKELTGIVLAVVCCAIVGYGSYQYGLEEGEKFGREAAVDEMTKLVAKVQDSLHNMCYKAANGDEENNKHLRAELIKTMYKYKEENARCRKDTTCGSKILWMKGCIAKTRFFMGDQTMDIGMVFNVDMDSNNITWTWIEGTQEEYIPNQTTRTQRIITRTKRLGRKIKKFFE